MKRILVVSLLGLCAFGISQVDPTRTVAIVNGEAIKGDEYYHRMEYLPGVSRRIQEGVNAEFPPGFLTLEQLVTERLILQLAKQRNVAPSQAEVDAEMKSITELDPKLLEAWIANGQSRSDFENQVPNLPLSYKLVILNKQFLKPRKMN